jgi:hypothetical protein
VNVLCCHSDSEPAAASNQHMQFSLPNGFGPEAELLLRCCKTAAFKLPEMSETQIQGTQTHQHLV